jgi:ABC-type sugar transport system substrate-binding protein
MKKLNVVISLLTQDNDYQLEQAASAQSAAVKLGIDVQIVYADNDAVLQTQQILKFIQDSGRRPDAILAEPVGTSMEQIARAAVKAGIGWGIINSNADYLSELRAQGQVPVFSVISDHEAIGRIQGQQIAAIIGQYGNILYIEGPSVRDVAKLRTKGMLAAKPAGISVKTLKGDWTQQSGYNAMKSWLSLSTSRQMKINMIACQNDDMAIGGRRAIEELTDLQERDSWLQLPLTGCDGVPRAGQEWVRQKKLTATVIAPALIGDAIRLLASAVESGSQPPERTSIAPSSYPEVKDLPRAKAHAAQ